MDDDWQPKLMGNLQGGGECLLLQSEWSRADAIQSTFADGNELWVIGQSQCLLDELLDAGFVCQVPGMELQTVALALFGR